MRRKGTHPQSAQPIRKIRSTLVNQYKNVSCGPVTVSENVATELRKDGTQSGFWDGGECEPPVRRRNVWNAAKNVRDRIAVLDAKRVAGLLARAPAEPEEWHEAGRFPQSSRPSSTLQVKIPASSPSLATY
jgi:hypothetical protein